MRRTFIILSGALLASPVSASFEEDRDRFDLWTECAGVDFLVETMDEDAAAFGLSTERVEGVAGSRLRAAGIHDDGSRENWLYLRVTVFDFSYVVEVGFQKRLLDEGTGLGMTASTWSRVGLGLSRSMEGDHVMGMVSEFLDTFIDDYLRVNEAACR